MAAVKKAKTTTDAMTPARATLSPEQFDRFVRLAQHAELKLAQIRYAKVLDELELAKLVAKRDAYYAEIAPSLGLPGNLSGCTSIRWDQDTLQVEVS